MRLVIDMQGAQTAGSSSRGIGRYTKALTQAIVRNRGEHEIFIALSGLFPDTIEPIRAAFDDLLPQENIRVWQAPGPVYWTDRENDSRRRCAELIREAFLADLMPDVTLVSSLFEGRGEDAVTSIATLSRIVPTAAILYDLIPLICRGPYLEDPVECAWYENKLDHLRRADLLLAISEASRQDGICRLGFPTEACVNISTAADPQFQRVRIDPGREAEIRRRFGIIRPFVMYTGGIDHRKNVEGLIRAYASLSRQLRAAHQLVIVCSVRDHDRSKLAFLAKQENLSKSDLVLTGFLPEDDLVALYNLCKVFVFPSLHEGFGLPALEAMSCGAPTIGSNRTSIPEVIGRDDALFDPRSDRSITEKLQQVLTDDSFRAELKDYGLEQARRFSWDRTAQTALKALGALHEKTAKKAAAIFLAPRRPKLAYVSPLPPVRSGISDYSAELLPELSRHYDIEVIVAQETVNDPWVRGNVPVRSVEWFKDRANLYERVLYHFGNAEFHADMFHLLESIPGVVVLHDFYLSSLLAHMETQGLEANPWTQALYHSHGYHAVQERYEKKDSAEVVWAYPCNLRVLQDSLGVIVHSEYSRRVANCWYGPEASQDWWVIPQLRVPDAQSDTATARRYLNLDEQDFVICSFGILGPTKLNHRLLDAWMASSLGKRPNCKLVFVGENPSGEYGEKLVTAIRNSPYSRRIQITGWVGGDTFKKWLAAADLAVQLRSLSRGETPRSVLDCMSHGTPVIVNSNGALSEFPDNTVWKLDDEFADDELTQALEELQQNSVYRKKLGEFGREALVTCHQPRACADRYAEAIERFYSHGAVGSPVLANEIGRLGPSLNGTDLSQIAADIAQNHIPLPRRRQLLVDVSELVRRDVRSGIQRVVRAILNDWVSNAPSGLIVEPVYATTTLKGYRYARCFTSRFMKTEAAWASDEPVEFQPGDIFLGLDLQPHVVAAQRSFYQDMRRHGVTVNFLVYDLLCIRMPHCFLKGAAGDYVKWLNVVAENDGAICISRSVADELCKWVEEHGRSALRPFKISWFHLGADFDTVAPTCRIPSDADDTLRALRSQPSFIMVGTIEPRKGHDQVIAAFEELWASGVQVNLVIVGNQGWMVEKCVDALKKHQELGRRLFWLDHISDEYLKELYVVCTCMIAASHGEGFGLPLIEAAKHNLPIIARDIPVFREVAGEHAYYFEGQNPAEFARAVQEWLRLHASGTHPRPDKIQWLTWKQSAERLREIVLQGHSHTRL